MSEKDEARPAGKFADEQRDGREDSTLTEYHSRIFAEAETRWKDNGPLRESFTAWAENEAENGRRFSPQRFFEVRRWQDHVDDKGKPERIDNTHIPIFTRFMLAEHPELREWCELRRSRFDAMFRESA